MLIFQKRQRTGPDDHEIRMQRPKFSGYGISQDLIWKKTHNLIFCQKVGTILHISHFTSI